VNVFVFDIETVPDVEGARRIHDLTDMNPEQVAEGLFMQQRQRKGNEFLPLHLQRIVAISAVFRSREKFQVWTLGDEDSSEAELIKRFFEGIERYSPTLVSWNGGGFDLPVLHYRSMVHGIAAPRYWDNGEDDSSFKWNNYLSRFHQRHTDLMDVLAGYQPRASAPLDQLASLCGFPGKLGMSGAKVWDYFVAGRIAEIRDYCETDVVNTYLLYLRYQRLRGRLDAKSYHSECRLVRDSLGQLPGAHWPEFLGAWINDDGKE
jgi:predicted PolB exonuclease-like 3'-5' exonuclease